jgi:hypothetical protein
MRNKLLQKIDLLTDREVEVILNMLNNNDLDIVEKYYEIRQKEKEFWIEHTKNWTNSANSFATNSANSFATNTLANYKNIYETK